MVGISPQKPTPTGPGRSGGRRAGGRRFPQPDCTGTRSRATVRRLVATARTLDEQLAAAANHLNVRTLLEQELDAEERKTAVDLGLTRRTFDAIERGLRRRKSRAAHADTRQWYNPVLA